MAGGGAMTADEWKLYVGAHLLAAATFMTFMFYCGFRVAEPLARIQIAPLAQRLYWCVKANVYICFMSVIINVIACTDLESNVQSFIGETALVLKPLEYILTCPFMMLSLVIMAGDRVPVRRQLEVTGITVMVLLSGFFAALAQNVVMKWAMFGYGCAVFVALLHRVSMSVKEHSNGTEFLFSCSRKGSVYRKLCIKTIVTWALFPIWWILSNDGTGLVSNVNLNTLVSTVLNIVAKGIFIIYTQKIHDAYISQESLMEKPVHTSRVEQLALESAARLGVTGAIEVLAKNMEKDAETIEHLKEIMRKRCAAGTEHIMEASDKICDDVVTFARQTSESSHLSSPNGSPCSKDRMHPQPRVSSTSTDKSTRVPSVRSVTSSTDSRTLAALINVSQARRNSLVRNNFIERQEADASQMGTASDLHRQDTSFIEPARTPSQAGPFLTL